MYKTVEKAVTVSVKRTTFFSNEDRGAFFSVRGNIIDEQGNEIIFPIQFIVHISKLHFNLNVGHRVSVLIQFDPEDHDYAHVVEIEEAK